MAFLTHLSASSTNIINTANPEVSPGNTKVNTASTEISTASFSNAIIYAFLSTQPQGCQLVHEDLVQFMMYALEEMDLKWNMALLSMRARKFYKRIGRKIIIDGSNTAGYDKSKVECFNCHKWDILLENAEHLGVKITEIGIKMVLDLIRVTWQRKKFRQTWLSWHSQILNDTGFKAATYKRGLSILEEQILKYKEHEVLFSEEIALLKRSVGELQPALIKSAKDLDQMLESQITDKSKKGVGYHAVPSPYPLILNRPTPFDLSYSGLEEFKQPEVNEYGPRDSSLKPTTCCDKESDNSKENTDDSLKQQQKTDSKTSSVIENNDAPIIEDWVSDDEDDDKPNPKVEKKTVIHTATKKEFVKPEKPVRRSVRSVNTGRPFSTARQRFNTGRQNVNTVRARGFNAVKPLSMIHETFFGCHVTILNTLDNLGKFDGKSDEGFFVGYSLSIKAFRVYNTRTRKVQENLHVGFLENKPMLEGNGVSESSTSSQQDQDCIVMPIWKDASYFGNATPRSIADAQIQDKDGLHNENDATEKSHDDSSVKDIGTAVNTASPEINTGSREVSTVAPEVNTATPEDLVGPSHGSEDTQVEVQEIELGNIPQSYAIPTTPHTRIHKSHPIEHVIGDVQSSVQTRRMTTSYTEQGFLSAIYEGKTHQDLHTCLFACFLSQEEPKRVSKALSDPAWVEAMQEELL
ncbi:putative ribonuclease H-like domain-containing protein [Tanacetum coccineum]